MTRKVAVIGAGACGIAAIKSCLEEGLQPVCFEKTDRIGGLWNYTGNLDDGSASVMKSTVTNTSKEMTAFSDFPPPANYPNYMHHSKLFEYFKSYVEHFNLERHIKVRHEVVKIRKASDFEKSGEWIVEYMDLSTDSVTSTTECFDAVMLCTGHYADKYIPAFAGAELFQGKQLHSLDYKNLHGYEDKTVVVIGLGNSGGDVAVELSRVAKQVYLSTRHGGWILPRLSDSGMPLDLVGQRRIIDLFKWLVGPTIMNKILRWKINNRFDHGMYGLLPKHEPLQQHPVINEELPNRIICGSVQIKSNIKRITETGVVFEDDTQVEADVIIYSTGYEFGFPFLEKVIVERTSGGVNLYDFVFPPDLSQASLAVIGCASPWGSLVPIAEQQCRWACRAFQRLVTLPSCKNMWRSIYERNETISRRYLATPRHSMEAEWIPYMDELAAKTGSKPNLWKLLLTDPSLYIKVMFGPCTPYQYRLVGPGAWPGARNAIMTQWDRIYKPLQTREVPTESTKLFTFQHLLLFVVICSVSFSNIRLCQAQM